ncbi:MAG: hypothetical protein HQM02_09910 [Magnetococcales bacterium]|nr:hypothetical protein [Magnetococcales bacterium]
MFESADLTRIKLDLLKGIPRAYSSMLTHLYQAGLTESDILNDAKNARLCGILDDYYERFILRA